MTNDDNLESNPTSSLLKIHLYYMTATDELTDNKRTDSALQLNLCRGKTLAVIVKIYWLINYTVYTGGEKVNVVRPIILLCNR